jgi:hypothetical protein
MMPYSEKDPKLVLKRRVLKGLRLNKGPIMLGEAELY